LLLLLVVGVGRGRWIAGISLALATPVPASTVPYCASKFHELCHEGGRNEKEELMFPPRVGGSRGVGGLTKLSSLATAMADEAAAEPGQSPQERILRQVEFYFGDANLPKDKFLLKQIAQDNEDGYVDLSVVAAFKKMKKFLKEHESEAACIAAIAFALQTSEVVELSPEFLRIRRIHPLPQADDSASRTVVAEAFTDTCQPSIDAITAAFAKCGAVTLVRVVNAAEQNRGEWKGCKHPAFRGADVLALVECVPLLLLLLPPPPLLLLLTALAAAGTPRRRRRATRASSSTSPRRTGAAACGCPRWRRAASRSGGSRRSTRRTRRLARRARPPRSPPAPTASRPAWPSSRPTRRAARSTRRAAAAAVAAVASTRLAAATGSGRG